jgi:hypothetical protein
VSGGGYYGTSPQDPVPALQGIVRRDEMDLQDWLTCVSSSTPKDKAEIQSLSAQISAARAAMTRAQQSQHSDVAVTRRNVVVGTSGRPAVSR